MGRGRGRRVGVVLVSVALWSAAMPSGWGRTMPAFEERAFEERAGWADSRGAPAEGAARAAAWVAREAPLLMHDGPPRYLGVALVDVSALAAVDEDLDRQGIPARGAYLLAIDPAGPTARAGLRGGDVIIAVGDREVESAADVVAQIRAHALGERVMVAFLRAGTVREARLEVVEAAPTARAAARRPLTVGLTVRTLSAALALAAGVDAHSQGALIVSVAQASPAARAGLRPGDVISAIDGRAVADARGLVEKLRAGGVRRRILRVLGVGRSPRSVTVLPARRAAPP